MNTLYYDLSSRRWLSTLSGRPAEGIALKLYSTVTVPIIFLRSGVPTSFGAGATATLTVKPYGNYSSSSVALASGWTAGATPGAYSFSLSLNTTPAAALLAGNIPNVRTMMEIRWTDGSTQDTTTALSCWLENATSTGAEGTPSEIVGLKATDTQAVDQTDTTHWMTPHATDLAVKVKSVNGYTGNVSITPANIGAASASSAVALAIAL